MLLSKLFRWLWSVCLRRLTAFDSPATKALKKLSATSTTSKQLFEELIPNKPGRHQFLTDMELLEWVALPNPPTRLLVEIRALQGRKGAALAFANQCIKHMEEQKILVEELQARLKKAGLSCTLQEHEPTSPEPSKQ